MTWIKVIEESEAVGHLKDLYRKYLEPTGVVDYIMMIHSLNPKSMKTHYELSRAQREMTQYGFHPVVADMIGRVERFIKATGAVTPSQP